MLNYVIPALCETCDLEQDVTAELPENYSDSDIREALDDTHVECSNCHDIDWSRSGGDITLAVAA